MARGAALLLCLLGFGCDDSSGDSSNFDTTSAPATKKNSGFSAGLAKDMTVKGSGAASGSATAPASGSATPPPSGSATPPTAGSATPPTSGSATAIAAGSAKDPTPDPKDPKPDPKAGSADPKAGSPDPKTGSGAVVTNRDSSPLTPVGSGSAKAGSGAPAVSVPRVAVKPSAEVAAIKLSLEPNWDRDVGEAGTISLVVKVPGGDATRVFAFRYGYEDGKAPSDRDAYKKWLIENNILKPNIDRQHGGSWYLEGVDGSGAPAFRSIVVWGGRKLICGGSLYKDTASNQLGDIRDKTVIQAKAICESIAL